MAQGGRAWKRWFGRVGLSPEIDAHDIALPPDDIAVAGFHGRPLLKRLALIVVIVARQAAPRAQTERIPIAACIRLLVE
jgi:hypothetical protein